MINSCFLVKIFFAKYKPTCAFVTGYDKTYEYQNKETKGVYYMLRIRLKRLGRKRQPHYRVIVCDSRIKREGLPIEEIGYYNPRQKELRLDKEKALAWISKGAQPSETVQDLIDSCDENGNFKEDVKQFRSERKSKAKEAKKVAEEAAAKKAAEEEAKKKAEEEAKAAAEAKAKEEAEAASDSSEETEAASV